MADPVIQATAKPKVPAAKPTASATAKATKPALPIPIAAYPGGSVQSMIDGLDSQPYKRTTTIHPDSIHVAYDDKDEIFQGSLFKQGKFTHVQQGNISCSDFDGDLRFDECKEKLPNGDKMVFRKDGSQDYEFNMKEFEPKFGL